jgi:hypothetical protein
MNIYILIRIRKDESGKPIPLTREARLDSLSPEMEAREQNRRFKGAATALQVLRHMSDDLRS